MKKRFVILMLMLMFMTTTKVKALTREDLQDMVVSTAMSYLHNNVYTDYDQYSMDASTTMSLANNKKATGNTFNWRRTNVNPEQISRTNIFSIDCSSFASIVYKYSLGYDFSEYYAVHKGLTYYTFDSKNNIFVKNTVSSAEDINKRLSQYGRGLNGRYYMAAAAVEHGVSSTKKTGSTASNTQDIILENMTAGKFYTDSTNKKMGVFIYKMKDTNNKTQRAEINTAIAKMESILQPGDIIGYTRINSTGKTTGHIMVYVGDVLGKKGIIHSTGGDYYNSDGVLNALTTSDDYYSVRFDTMDYLYDGRLRKQNITYLTIVRPINKYCTSTSCTTDSKLSTNAHARRNLKWLRVEQYARTSKPSIDSSNLDQASKDYNINIGQYNSVNVGDKIEYTLYLHNRSYRYYCTGVGAGGYHDKSTCTSKTDRKWEQLGSKMSYSNYKVTAYLPENTTFVECNYNCVQNGNKLTWTPSTLSNGEYISIRYTVTVNKETDIINKGMQLTYKNQTLKLGEIKTKVNPTLNKVNAEKFREAIKEFKTAISKTKPEITYGSSSSSYKVKPSEAKSTTFTSYGFVKNIYYNAMGIELDDLSGSNIKNAIFNKDKTYDSYAKKTEAEITKLTNQKYININKMLVKGFYGGRNLKGNDNADRTGRLRLTDLEFGDIIVIFATSDGKVAGTSALYMYLGNTKIDGDLSSAENDKKGTFIRFSSGNKLTTYTEKSSKTAYQFFNELWSKELFVVLRPTQLYGTTIQYSGGTILGKNSSVEYNTYKNLRDLKSTKEYTLKLDYIKNSKDYKCDNCKTEYKQISQFSGWYTDKYKTEITNGSSLKQKTSYTIYSRWLNRVTLPKATYTTSTSAQHISEWCTNKKCTGTTYKAGSVFALNSNSTPTKQLYAKWVNNTYTVKYNANGGTGKMSNSTHEYSVGSKLNENNFTKEGYAFDGWTQTKNGTEKIPDGATVTNLTSEDGKEITLYATWRVKEKDEFKVSLKLKNATSDSTSKIIKTTGTATFTIQPKSGYSNCKTNSETYKLIDGKLTVSNIKKDTTITVTCSGIKYSVIYNSNGGKGTMPNSTHTYGVAKPLSKNEYERIGYNFKGWSIKVNEPIKYIDKENVVNLTTSKNYNLYAVWSAKTYKIDYVLNDGILDNKITTYKITSEDIILDKPIKEGCKFIGWTTENNQTPQLEVVIKKGSTGDKKYTANYKIGKYTITYKSDKYGKITGITEETLDYKANPNGTTQSIKEGYKALKWAVNKDVVLTDGKEILEGNPITEEQIKKIVVKNDLIITAYHYAKKYKVSYLSGSNGKITGITNEEVSYNSNPLGTKTTPDRGYKLEYWTANKTVKLNDGTKISKGSKINNIKNIIVTEDIALTPVFKQSKFKIAYLSDENSVIIGKEIQNITFPNTLSLTQTASLDENYEFQHWTSNTDVLLNDNTEIKKGEPITNDELTKVVATNDMELTANYSQTLYNVYYSNYEDIVITENPKETLDKNGKLSGPLLERERWDKPIVYVSDKDVTLSDGNVIKAGKAISEQELGLIVIAEDLNITPRYESDLKLFNTENLNLDLILTIIFIIIVIPVSIFVFKTIKKQKKTGI